MSFLYPSKAAVSSVNTGTKENVRNHSSSSFEEVTASGEKGLDNQALSNLYNNNTNNNNNNNYHNNNNINHNNSNTNNNNDMEQEEPGSGSSVLPKHEPVSLLRLETDKIYNLTQHGRLALADRLNNLQYLHKQICCTAININKQISQYNDIIAEVVAIDKSSPENICPDCCNITNIFKTINTSPRNIHEQIMFISNIVYPHMGRAHCKSDRRLPTYTMTSALAELITVTVNSHTCNECNVNIGNICGASNAYFITFHSLKQYAHLREIIKYTQVPKLPDSVDLTRYGIEPNPGPPNVLTGYIPNTNSYGVGGCYGQGTSCIATGFLQSGQTYPMVTNGWTAPTTIDIDWSLTVTSSYVTVSYTFASYGITCNFYDSANNAVSYYATPIFGYTPGGTPFKHSYRQQFKYEAVQTAGIGYAVKVGCFLQECTQPVAGSITCYSDSTSTQRFVAAVVNWAVSYTTPSDFVIPVGAPAHAGTTNTGILNIGSIGSILTPVSLNANITIPQTDVLPIYIPDKWQPITVSILGWENDPELCSNKTKNKKQHALNGNTSLNTSDLLANLSGKSTTKQLLTTVSPQPYELKFNMSQNSNTNRSQSPDQFKSVDDLDSYIRHTLSRDKKVFNMYCILYLLDGWDTIDLPVTHIPDDLSREIFTAYDSVDSAVVDSVDKATPIQEKVKQQSRKVNVNSHPNNQKVQSSTTLSPEAKAANFEAVLKRIASKLNTPEKFLELIISQATNYKKQFLRSIWARRQFDEDVTTNSIAFIFVESWMVDKECKICLLALTPLFPGLVKASKTALWKDWLNSYFISDVDDDGYIHAISRIERNRHTHMINGNIYYWSIASKVRNKLMHALNGNTSIIATTMEEVESSTELNSVIEQSEPSDPIEAVKDMAKNTGYQGPQGQSTVNSYNVNNYFSQMITTANVTQSMCINIPELMMFPRHVRNGLNAGIIPSTNRLSWFVVGTLNYPGRGITLTAEAESLLNTQKEGRLRPDAVTTNGYRGIDITALAGSVNMSKPSGDSMVTFFLRLALFNKTIAWRVNTNFQPGSCLIPGMDQFSKSNPLLAGVTNLSMNSVDPAGFGENCGGNVPFLPIGNAPSTPIFNNTPVQGGYYAPPAVGLANSCGRFSIHTDISSIPYNERSSVIVMPTSIYITTENQNPSINVAMMMIGLTNYPHGIHMGQVNTYDNQIGPTNPAIQSCIPMSNLVIIPGLTTMRILIPLTNNSLIASDVLSANRSVVSPVFTGPTPSNTMGAFLPLQVSYQTQIFEYSIADYLYTFTAGLAPPIDQTTIQRFVSQCATFYGRIDDLKAAIEWADVLSCRYAPMCVYQNANPFYFNTNSPSSVATQSYAGLLQFTAVNNYPVTLTGAPDYTLPGLNLLWMASLGIGAAVPDTNIGSFSNDKSITSMADPNICSLSIYTARKYTAGMQTFYSTIGLSSDTWNTILTNTLFTSLKQTARMLFTQNLSNDTGPVIAPLGAHIAKITGVITGNKLQVDSFGNGLASYLNTPIIGFSQPYLADGVFATNIMPAMLPDTWYYSVCKIVPKGLQAFMVPNKNQRGIPLSTESISNWNNGSMGVPINASKRFALTIGTNEYPDRSDNEYYNSRLIAVLSVAQGGGGSLYTTDGGDAPGGILPTRLLCQKAIASSDQGLAGQYVFARPVTAWTGWMPSIDFNGRNLIIGVSNANNPSLMTRVIAGVSPPTLEVVLYPTKQPMPSVIIGGSKTNPFKFFIATSEKKSDASSVTDSKKEAPLSSVIEVLKQ